MLTKTLARGDLLPTCDADFFRVLYTPPTPSARVAPTGIRLKDGHGPHKALMTIAADTNINIWEIEVGLPGYDNGEAIDITTQWNDDFRTFWTRYLHTLTEFTVVGAFDPILYTEVLAIRGVVTTFTIQFTDLSTLAFYAYVRMMEFDAMVEGTMPRVTLTIKPTNADPTTAEEEAPVLTNVPGT